MGRPAIVRDALADLGSERIGHGVRAIEDLALVDELAETGVVLEVCPGSNIALGLYADWRSHPIGAALPARRQGHAFRPTIRRFFTPP